MMKTLSEGVGLEGGTPRRERNDLPDWGGDILDGGRGGGLGGLMVVVVGRTVVSLRTVA